MVPIGDTTGDIRTIFGIFICLLHIFGTIYPPSTCILLGIMDIYDRLPGKKEVISFWKYLILGGLCVLDGADSVVCIFTRSKFLLGDRGE